MSIRIVIADDHAIVREGLRAVLQTRPDLEVVGEAADGEEAVRQCRHLKPDLVIMDIAMPKMNGIEATRAILQHQPAVRVLALSMHAQKQFVKSILEAGAAGYLLKNCVSDEIRTAIERVMAGGSYLCTKTASLVVDEYLSSMRVKATSPEQPVLSERERQVLQRIAEGKQTKEIATVLFISPRTVEMYRAKLMRKLGVDSVAELTKLAIRMGITTLE